VLSARSTNADHSLAWAVPRPVRKGEWLIEATHLHSKNTAGITGEFEGGVTAAQLAIEGKYEPGEPGIVNLFVPPRVHERPAKTEFCLIEIRPS
jgi:hypothetical protein